MAQVSLSILSCDFLHLGEELTRLSPFVDRIHFDVMDGHFVPHISFGISLLQQLPKGLPIDVHLMVANPDEVFRDYIPFADVLYIHYESARELTLEVLKHIRDAGKSAGLTLNPETPVSAVAERLQHCTHITIMSVHPGAGGQACMVETLDKIPEVKKINPNIIVTVDGGMNAETAPLARAKGADILVSGSFLSKNTDVEAAAKILRGYVQ